MSEANHTYLVAPERKEVKGESVFLVGPITNAPDWQARAAELLKPHMNVFNPRRPWFGKKEDTPERKDIFEEQVDWELDYQEKADVILVWFANPIEENHNRMIARTTRVEVGWHVGAKKSLVVGIEPGFSGERYLRKFLTRYGMDVYDNLEDTCEAAVNLLQKSSKKR